MKFFKYLTFFLLFQALLHEDTFVAEGKEIFSLLKILRRLTRYDEKRNPLAQIPVAIFC